MWEALLDSSQNSTTQSPLVGSGKEQTVLESDARHPGIEAPTQFHSALHVLGFYILEFNEPHMETTGRKMHLNSQDFLVLLPYAHSIP